MTLSRDSCLDVRVLKKLILAEDLVSGITDQDEPVDVVYLDFSNLIDSACHRLQGKKMVTMGIHLHKTRWL